MNDQTTRYQRQILLREIGADGMKQIAQASVTLIGCGALGTGMADILVRAGVGRLRIVDRDFVELSNLQRQTLFCEQDARDALPKAVAAETKLKAVNSSVTIEPRVEDATPRNIEELISGATLVLDGTDNAETRYLINDACIKHRIDWVYGGAVGTGGLIAAIRPKVGPCLRCILPEPPPAGTLPTCDTAGVLSTATLSVAALQATRGLKLILGIDDDLGTLTRLDVWQGRMTAITVERAPDCPACIHDRFDFLKAERTSWTTRLCGRNAVQITPAAPVALDLAALSETLAKAVDATYNGLMLTIKDPPLEIVLFPDGRSIVKGTDDEIRARSVVAKHIGG